ncbi:lecithin retinol acyltransferase family protein [Parasalinivibrio latis]|uniref:lecithin retinol acyltransferase family protein n=1 Tax=Parasalinivibrio latis TaxID=2952610 RepID=UPI003DA43975
MNTIEVKAGDVVATTFGFYQHFSLVTDKISDDGKPMLISATKRNGTVKEEPWDVVTEGKPTYVVDAKYDDPISTVIERARSQIGVWKYEVTSHNCEHFVNWVTNLNITSAQVAAGVVGGLTGAVIAGACAENPRLITFLGGALVVGGLAVALTRATEKSPE